jgi:signal transduction histidine kinase
LDENRQASLEEELLNLIANQVRLSPYNMLLAMAIIAYMMFQHIPDKPLIWGGWMLMVLVSQLYRRNRLLKLPEEVHTPVQQRTREAALINLSVTLIMGLCFFAFPIFTPFEAAIQTMIFIAMGAGSIVATLGWAPFTLAHICLNLLPLFGLWAWSGLYGPAGAVGVFSAIIGVSYSYTMWFFSKNLYKMNEDFFANRTALATALNDAEVAGMAKTRFLAAASHDLRQPIHALSLFSAALSMRPLDEQSQHISNNINESIETLALQLDALLDVSKLDAGIVPVNLAAVNLHTLIDRLHENFEAMAAENTIELRFECPVEAVTTTDPALLERIVRNILTNAINHNSDCIVSVSAVLRDGSWQLTIADNGQGIPASEQAHIFEEFYQVDNPERDRSQGLGLGLAIVKRLSNLLDLKMDFESNPGLGTHFTFTLPYTVRQSSVDHDAALQTASLAGIYVLVVDDEISVRNGMKMLLETHGCEVTLADSTDEAMAAARRRKPDLALVDYRLRGKDNGLATIEALRALYTGLPAIIVSGDTGPDRLQQLKATGILLLSKPVDKASLKNAIAAACH